MALALPSATFNPSDVPVTTLVDPPLVVVVVKVTVAVVVAVHEVQDVQGAFKSHSPDVQPIQVVPGQPFPDHQLVHGPDVHDPVEPQGPQSPPKGPNPTPHGLLLLVYVVAHALLEVAEKVASGLR